MRDQFRTGGLDFQRVFHVLSNARMRTLNADPYTLVPARKGYGFIPVYLAFVKESGAYILGAASSFEIRATDSSGLRLMAEVTSTVFDIEGVLALLVVGPGSASGNFPSGQATDNAPLVLTMVGGELQGDQGGSVSLDLYYVEIPMSHVLGR